MFNKHASMPLCLVWLLPSFVRVLVPLIFVATAHSGQFLAIVWLNGTQLGHSDVTP
jgi:hypothetical protein